MRFSGGLRRGQGEPGESPGAAQIDALKDGGHLGWCDLDTAVLGFGKAKGAFLEPLDAGITMPSFLWRYTNLVRSNGSGSMGRWVPWLSCRTALGNDQLGVPGGDPRVLPGRQLSQTLKLILVGPDDQMLPRRRPA